VPGGAAARSAGEFQQAFQLLRDQSWYLHKRPNDAWYFAETENLRKRIENRAHDAPSPKIEAEMRRRLKEMFRPERKAAYETVHALP
jgi:hypothetical protein